MNTYDDYEDDEGDEGDEGDDYTPPFDDPNSYDERFLQAIVSSQAIPRRGVWL